MGWRILDWYKFEPKHRTDRPTMFQSRLPYLMITTTQNASYKRLVRGANGSNNLGVWLGLLEYWGRQTKTKRQEGKLWNKDKLATIDDISVDSGLSAAAIKTAIPILCNVKWLEEVVDQCHTSVIPRYDTGALNLNTESESEVKLNTESESEVKLNTESEKKEKTNCRTHVFLTVAEYQKLKEKYQDPDLVERMLDKLDAYKGSTGKTYKSDYLAILSWVADGILAKQPKDRGQEYREQAAQAARLSKDKPNGHI